MNALVTRSGMLAVLVGLSAMLGGCGFTQPIWEDGFLFWWQIPVVLLLVGLIIFWTQYRKRQM
ncbi:MAG: hypothetical protein FWE88_06290 [Phycisphaerae bacterium]|nr:hypothetical protein [Phycisphaerae bacterium]